MLVQLPSHVVCALICAADAHVVAWLDTPHPFLHRLALDTLFPSLSHRSLPTIDMHSDTFRFPPPDKTLEATLAATATFTSLRELHCSLVPATAPHFSEALQLSFVSAVTALKHIEALSVQWGMCTPTVVEAISTAAPTFPTLKALTLSAEPWMKAPYLARALGECEGLTKLHLRAVYVQGGHEHSVTPPAAVSDADPMFTSLLRMTKLQSLQLSYRAATSQLFSPMENIILEPCSDAAKAVQNLLPQVTSLDFEGMSCVGRGMVAFSGLMTAVKATLKALNISYNLMQTRALLLCPQH